MDESQVINVAMLFGIIIGGFFGTLWNNWIAYLLYCIVLIIISICISFRRKFKEVRK